MAHANAEKLIEAIPECMRGCFDIGVAATGCDDTDYDCWCYEDVKNNHQILVSTMYECLDNRERRTKKKCTKDEYFGMENSYWKMCEEYWEPYGTAVEPSTIATTAASATSKASSKASTTEAAEATETTEAPQTTLTSSLQETTSSVEQLLTDSPEPSSISDSELSQTSDEATVTNHRLSSGAQAGIGFGVALGVILIGVAVFMWLRERRRRRDLQEQLKAAEIAQASYGHGGGQYESKVYFEMEGSRPHAEELRGDMRTPELSPGTPDLTAVTGLDGRSKNSTMVEPVSPARSRADSEFSVKSYEWPISPESPTPGRVVPLGDARDTKPPPAP
ncbi:hypothetical protein F66182_4268 [Fusarium sp. NRRL 66182]|nr:hypothetical protein F66182_4268 [Fusarium sp. NRRL 66182]